MAANFDLSVFHDESQNDCNGKSDINNCVSLKRLVVSLNYYTKLSQNYQQNEDIFLLFIKEVYKQFIDDYIHFMNDHKNKLSASNKDLSTTECDMDKCSFTVRHFDEDNIDQDIAFHTQIMDSLHFNLYHLKQAGLRIDNKINDDSDNNQQDEFFDVKFATINKHVNKTKKIREKFSRFAVNKFHFDDIQDETKINMIINNLNDPKQRIISLSGIFI